MAGKQPTVVWGRVIDFLDFETSAGLAEVSRRLRKILNDMRFGCHRCGRWMKAFDYDFEYKDDIFHLDGDAHCWYTDSGHREMYCICGAIYNFCSKCLGQSTFMQHSGYYDQILPGTDGGVTADRILGTGIDANSIFVETISSSVLRSKPGVPMLLKQYDAEGTEIRNPDIAQEDYTEFYLGDLGRKYAVSDEQIGDAVYSFALTGPDGGYGTDWYCGRCDFAYSVTDK